MDWLYKIYNFRHNTKYDAIDDETIDIKFLKLIPSSVVLLLFIINSCTELNKYNKKNTARANLDFAKSADIISAVQPREYLFIASLSCTVESFLQFHYINALLM